MPTDHRTSRLKRRSRFITLSLIMLAGLALTLIRWFGPQQQRATSAGSPPTVRVIAGDGVGGIDDGEARHARFADPFGVAVASDGMIYVADGAESDRIRRISPGGIVSTIAGGQTGFADGNGAAARFSTPSAIAVDATGAVYVADTGNNAIRRVTRDGRVSTIAGDGVAGFRDGPAAQARFNAPIGVAIDASGRIVVADTYNDRIRAVAPDGSVSTIAGDEAGAVDGPVSAARFDTPAGVAVDRDGTIYVADTGNDVVRVIAPEGVVTTIDAAAAGGLLRPTGITVDRTGGIYVTDERGRIVAIAPDGMGRVLAGSTPGFRDGDAVQAQFRRPSGLASPEPGRVVVADAGNGLVRVVDATMDREARPPSSPQIAPRFDAETFAWQPILWPLDPQYGPFEVAGTMGEARAEGAARFHAGIDVHAGEGNDVLAVRDGVVATVIATGEFGSLSEWLRIGPLGYVHVRAGRRRNGTPFDAARFAATRVVTGKVTRIRVKRGARFSTGDTIGTANRFNHVHLNVGWPGDEYNPLLFRLPQFTDTVPPTIARGGIRIYSDDGKALTRRVKGRLVVGGRVQIVVDAWDQVNGNRPQRRLGIYRLGYQVLRRDGSPAAGFGAPRDNIVFDRLGSPDAPRLVYAPGSGIPFYGGRRTRFLYVVTNTFRDGVAGQEFWDTSSLPPGDYVVRVYVADRDGNEATANRDLPVTVVSSE